MPILNSICCLFDPKCRPISALPAQLSERLVLSAILSISVINELLSESYYKTVVIESWSQNSNSHFVAQLAAAVMTI